MDPAAPSLSNAEIRRYGRQMLVPQFGSRAAQERLKAARVLIAGAGGLGAPAALYLAAAGIGTLGLADHDAVDVSNLHRQVIHTEATVGMRKTSSARAAVERLNHHVAVVEHDVLLDSGNALDLVRGYDVVLDCSDNAATRYLLNDACVLLDMPLVSGSALRAEGQLTTYHHAGGPCYRCLFPTPPPPETVTNCDDGGVLGPVTGTIGSMMAMEAIKVLLTTAVAKGTLSADALRPSPETYAGRMLIMDTWAGTFRVVRLRTRRRDCAVCGDNPTIKQLADYVLMCGSGATDKTKPVRLLTPSQRISVTDLAQRLAQSPEPTPTATTKPIVLLDVREPHQFAIAHLPTSINVPLRQFTARATELRALAATAAAEGRDLVVLCRRGNDSQRAVARLRRAGNGEDDVLGVHPVFTAAVDVVGGLEAWSEQVDPAFPRY